MICCFKTFKLKREAAAFITEIGKKSLIGVTQFSQMITVWYWSPKTKELVDGKEKG
jgi:hypothetical protein